MFDLSKKDQNTENEIQKQEIVNQQTKILDNDLPMILKSLEVEEQALLEEKANLASIEEKLTQRLKDEICIKEAKISELKQKIPELKQNCEKMANALGIKTQK